MMKNQAFFLHFLVFGLIAVALMSSCGSRSANTEVLTSKVQYDVPVSNNDPQLDWWINNIEGSRREPFLKRLMEAAGAGEVKAFDYFGMPMTAAQVKAAGNDTVYQTLLRIVPPYEEYDTMIVKTISYRDIVKIRFMEEWRWNPDDLEMEKHILAIGPVIEREFASQRYSQLLFWVSLDERFPE